MSSVINETLLLIKRHLRQGLIFLMAERAVSSSNPLPVQSLLTRHLHDRSSTITTGGAAQVAMAALSTRKAYFFQNISSESMWGSFTGTAAPSTVGSFEIVSFYPLDDNINDNAALSIYGE